MHMSVGIRVTPAQLQELSGRVGSGGTQIDGELRALAGALGPLGSDWAGLAQAQFLSLWQEWQRSAQQLQAALTGISSLLGQAGRAYADAESQIAGSFATG
jgi:WXG100 family type VII secretion target